MINLKSVTAAVFAIGLVGAANAAEHEIFMGEGGFFPQITYLAPGDTVVFINASDGNATAMAADESWTTGSLGMDETYILTVGADIEKSFIFDSPTFAPSDENTGTGALSFDPAPLN